ncbi:hypothetical protein GQ53DRAFT_838021 [Thozetella sp. PMI_491]|nr:hypothetical protein GQ53DRAFT_838021 [Thozetella sp. PMI_491]
MKTPSDGPASSPNLRRPRCGSASSSSPETSNLERDVKRAKPSSAQSGRTKMLSPPLTPLMPKSSPVVDAFLEPQQRTHAISEEDVRLCGSQFTKPRNCEVSRNLDLSSLTQRIAALVPPTHQDMKSYRSLTTATPERNPDPVLLRALERVRPPDIDAQTSPREYEALAPTMQQSPPSTCEADLNRDDFSDRTGDSISSFSPRSSIGSETSYPHGHDAIQTISIEDNPVPEKSNSAGNGPSYGNSMSRGGSTGQTSSKKRHHKAAFGETPGSDLGDERSPIARRRTQESDKGPEPLLACPFYKKNRQKYQKCLHYQLRRIKDVKQHITRCHSQPDFYCARCYDVFESAVHRDEHTRSTSCEIRDPPQFDGVSPEGKKRLNQQYISRGKTIEGQWHDMWDIIFPGVSRPESVYVGNYIDEAIQLLRTVWGSRSSDIISTVVGRDRLGGLDREDLDSTIRLLLHSLSETSREGSELAGAAMSPPSPPSPCESYLATVPGTSLPYESIQGFGDDSRFNSSQADFRNGGVEFANTAFHCDTAGMATFQGAGSSPLIFDGQWEDLMDEGFDFLEPWVKDEN